jgi:hypothetical protein
VFDTRRGTTKEMIRVLTGTYRNGLPAERPRATGADIEWTAEP